MNNIEVIVKGLTNSGKSTVLEIIANALTDTGVQHEFVYEVSEHPLFRPESFEQRLESLRESGTTIVLREEWLLRRGFYYEQS